jgi:hypothetical protein
MTFGLAGEFKHKPTTYGNDFLRNHFSYAIYFALCTETHTPYFIKDSVIVSQIIMIYIIIRRPNFANH